MNFAVDPTAVLAFLTKGVFYSRRHDVFLRELVQNSLDSIAHRRALYPDPDFQGRIVVRYEQASPGLRAAITVTDNGIGLTRQGIEDDLLRPMAPQSRRARGRNPRLRDHEGEFIGRHGMGLMTVFHVSDSVYVSTRHPEEKTGHCLKISLRWQPSQDGAEPEPARLDVDHDDSLGKYGRILDECGTSIRVVLGSEHPVNQEMSARFSGDRLCAGLEYYMRHRCRGVRLTVCVDGDEHELRDNRYVGEDSHFVAFDDWGEYATITLAPRSSEPPTIGFMVCLRGILVSLDHLNILDNPGRALVGEINFHDTRMINLKPSRDECVEDRLFEQVQLRVRSLVEAFDASYKQRQSALFAVPPGASGRTTRPTWRGAAADTEALQEFLRAYFVHGYEYQRDAVLECLRLHTVAPTENERVTYGEIVQKCRASDRARIFFYYDDEQRVEHAGTIHGEDVFVRQYSRFAAAAAFGRQSGELILCLPREGRGKHSVEHLLRTSFAFDRISLEELPHSYELLSRFMHATPLPLRLPVRAAFISAGTGGRLVYPHPEGVWVNRNATSARQFEHDTLESALVLCHYGLKFAELNALLMHVGAPARRDPA